jgi:hypothetical protein
MVKGQRGPEVAEAQRQLLALGYPVGAADGICGPKTLAAWEAWERAKARGVTPRMGLHFQEHAHGVRDWASIDSVVLHQTACDLGERPGRWDSLRAQVGVTRGGQVFQVYPLDTLVYHGNSFNKRSVGVELSGSYEGIEGQRATWWQPEGVKDPQRPTPELIEAARRAVRWIVAEVGARGGKVRYCFSHRQSSDTRQSDPGSAIWQAVGLWAQSELGLSDGGPGFRVGDGRPIPEAWGGEGPY